MSKESRNISRPVLRSIGIILLVILLALIGALVFLYFSITTDNVTIDDPAALAAQTPMPASQRFVFDAANETAQIRLEKSDLWYLLLPDMGEDFLETVNKELEDYQLSVTGYGLAISEEGVCIDLEAMYKTIRLPVHILTSSEFDASGFSLTLTKAKLGPFQLPVENLLSSVDGRIDVDWPVITEITDASYQQDAVLLTGTITQDLLSCVQKACRNDAIGWFCTSRQELFRAARAEDGFRAFLPGLEQDPGSVETLYHDLFTLAQVDELEEYMLNSKDLPYRFFPGIDYDGLEAERDSIRDQWVFANVMTDKLVAEVSIDYNNRRFSLKKGEFYLGKSVFDPLNYFGGDTALKMEQLFHIIDKDKFHLILVGSIDGYAVDSPILNKVCAKNQALTQELNRKEAYPVGCIFQGVNGEYFLRYESMEILTGGQVSKFFKTVILTEEEYASLVQDGKIGVWVG